MKDLYSVLGVPRDADQATIKKAYKKLARQFHPDVNQGDAAAAERFKEVSAAYAVLEDEEKRALYDEFGESSLQTGFDADRARAWKQQAGGAWRGAGPGMGGGIDLDDLFGSIFQTNRTRARSGQRGADIETELDVDLLDALRGGEQVITFQRPAECGTCTGSGGTGRQACARCNGSGQVSMRQFGFMDAIVACDTCGGTGSLFAAECGNCAGTGRTMVQERLKVRIPAGVADGQIIRLRGKGGAGRGGGREGDLLMRVALRPHPFLVRKGDDLEMELPITFGEALVGATVEVPTLDGSVRLKVPAGAKNGQRMRLKGKGAALEGRVGDLFVVLRPTPPKDASGAEALAHELDRLYGEDVRADLRL